MATGASTYGFCGDSDCTADECPRPERQGGDRAVSAVAEAFVPSDPSPSAAFGETLDAALEAR